MKELGDEVEALLKRIGVDKEMVENWLGRPCGCDERKQKLNEFSRWVKRGVKGSLEKTKRYLLNIIGDDDDRKDDRNDKRFR